MSYKDKETRNAYARKYQGSHRESIRQRKHRYYLKNRERLLKYSREYQANHPERRQEWNRKFADKFKIEVLTYYGGGELACVGCGDTRIDCLSIDHINNDGAKHRKAGALTGDKLYRQLKRENYPEGFQALCMNCQFIKRKTKQTPNFKERYVLLSEDQSLPEIPYIDDLEYGEQTCHDFRWGANVMGKDIIKDGWVKRKK